MILPAWLEDDWPAESLCVRSGARCYGRCPVPGRFRAGTSPAAWRAARPSTEPIAVALGLAPAVALEFRVLHWRPGHLLCDGSCERSPGMPGFAVGLGEAVFHQAAYNPAEFGSGSQSPAGGPHCPWTLGRLPGGYSLALMLYPDAAVGQFQDLHLSSGITAAGRRPSTRSWVARQPPKPCYTATTKLI